MSKESLTRISAEEQATFDRDGIVLIRNAVTPERVEQIHRITDQVLSTPSQFAGDADTDGGRMFTDRYLWRENEEVRDFAFNSGIAELVGTLVGTSSLRFYFDHLLIKEPGTPNLTPWHQDIPYWPFLGKKIASAWVTATDLKVEDSGLEFVRGSHQWDKYFSPASFTSASSDWAGDADLEELPDINANRQDYDIVGYDMKAGDALIFSAWILHGAPGNPGNLRRVALSTRWLGDDALWSPRPNSDPSVRQEHTTVQPGQYPADDDRFPVVWRSGT